MKLVDYVLIAILVVIVAAAIFFIYRSKKSGKKCIGCPDNCACAKGNCSSGCHSCKEK